MSVLRSDWADDAPRSLEDGKGVDGMRIPVSERLRDRGNVGE